MDTPTNHTPSDEQERAAAALRSYRHAAAVLSYFDPGALKPLDMQYAGDDDAVLDLLEECERVRTETGAWRWMLKNSVRREALRELLPPSLTQHFALIEVGVTPEEVRERARLEVICRALAINQPRPTDILQQTFEAYVTSSAPPSLEQQSVAELTATLQVRDWLEGILDDRLPNYEELLNRLEWQRLLEPFRQLVGDHFRGRRKELDDIGKFFADAQPHRSIYQAQPLMIFGPGGVGKSTLLAKFILETVDKEAADEADSATDNAAFVLCYWDFDRTTLLPEEPLTLLAELVLQLSLRFPAIKPQAQKMRQQMLQELSDAAGADHAVQTRQGERGVAVYRGVAKRNIQGSHRALSRHLADFKKLAGELPSARSLRLLLALDTFERVQEVSFDFTRALWDFLNEVQSCFPRMRVIVTGRAELSEEIAHQPYELRELDEEAAKGYLDYLGVANPQLADAIFKRVGGDPLSLRLVVDGLRQDRGQDGDLARLTTLPADFGELRADHEFNQGWLYRRYLERIRDREIQRLAHPGLVLRRVTPALIRQVLAGPCKLVVPSDEVAEGLFDRLASQASLVKREGPWALRHRPDVRKRMLRPLLQTEANAVFEIHCLAVDFYAQQPPSAEARAEEIYHRLFLAQNQEALREIDERWEPGVAPLLRDAQDEVPPEVRSYLIAKLENSSDKFDWNQADAFSKEMFVVVRAQDALITNQPLEALRAVAEIRDRLPGSKLYRLEAQALERLGRYAEARIVANEGLFSARKARDNALALDLLLIALRANEVMGKYERAAELLDEAEELDLKLPSPQAELLALEFQIHRLRLCRLDHARCQEKIAELRQAAYAALNPLFEIAARQNALLLLDAVEEVGIAQPEVIARVVAVFPSVFDVETNSRHVASLLREWADAPAVRRRSAGGDVLALIARALEDGQREKALRVAGLEPAQSWAQFFDHLCNTFPPPQPFVSGLVGLIRTTIIGAHQPATSTSTLLQQTATAVYSAFETRDQLLAFLHEEFPDALRPPKTASYNEALLELVTSFERQGKTETLIARALAHQPDNQLLQAMQQHLATATDDAPASATVGEGNQGITIAGDVRNATITTGGAVQISGDVRNTTFLIFDRYIPREVLAALPKALPPFTPEIALQQALAAAPELVFNWALGMRQAMRAVCLVEAPQMMGTAFLVAPNLLLWPRRFELSAEQWRNTRFRFDYRHAPDGSSSQPVVHILAKDWLVATNKELDYTLLRLDEMPGLEQAPGENATRGWLTLTAAPVVAGQSMFMLHHAWGQEQMLEYAAARQTNDGRIEVATLTTHGAPGAAGAPCCNEAWQVMAIREGKKTSDQTLMVIWAKDLLADAEFSRALNEHLAVAQGAEDDQVGRLIQTLNDRFNYDQLKAFALRLGVIWEDLPGETRSEKAQSLIKQANQQGLLGALAQSLAELLPQAARQLLK